MDEGLMGVVAKLPLERNFKLEHVKEVTPGWPSHASAGWQTSVSSIPGCIAADPHPLSCPPV